MDSNHFRFTISVLNGISGGKRAFGTRHVGQWKDVSWLSPDMVFKEQVYSCILVGYCLMVSGNAQRLRRSTTISHPDVVQSTTLEGSSF